MIGPQMRLQLISGDSARVDNNHLSMLPHLSEVILQERSNVRDRLLDMLPIGTNEPTQRHVVIPNFNGASFPQQILDQLDLRALPEIIGGSLETQPQDRDIPIAGIEHHPDGSFRCLSLLGRMASNRGSLRSSSLAR